MPNITPNITRSITSSAHPSSRYRSPLALHAHLTPRDREILTLLEHHRVATSDQLARVFFTHLRTCQLRLDVLRRLELIDRFRFARPYGGTERWKWVLGLAGARFQAAVAGLPSPTDRAHRDYVLRLSTSPTLDHLLSANEFFVRLHHATRTAGIPDRMGLERWWSERTATARFGNVKPDGHGIWTAHGRTVGLFLECDLGTENLQRLRSKLPGYARLAACGGPTYPVLFWLPSPEREAHLHNLLRKDPPPPHVPVATATHDADPAGRVWLPLGGSQHLHLHQLPSNHGPDAAGNANWIDGQLDLTNQRPVLG